MPCLQTAGDRLERLLRPVQAERRRGFDRRELRRQKLDAGGGLLELLRDEGSRPAVPSTAVALRALARVIWRS